MSHVIAVLNHGRQGKGRCRNRLHLDTSLPGAKFRFGVESPMCQQAN